MLANKYRCDIIFNYDGDVANAKSIINLMSIFSHIKKLPATIEILFKGWSDAQEAFDTIISTMKETKFVL
ncbi:HPr family phosphocarrier protein [bacterium]|nr:HPr family phosphocarrier protein [bacterium]